MVINPLQWNSKAQLIGIAAVVVALTQIGNGAKALGYLVRTPEIAYAAMEKASDNESEFNEFISELRGYTRAQNEMNQQIRIQQAPPRIERYWDERAQRYWCTDGQQDWWADDNGRCE